MTSLPLQPSEPDSASADLFGCHSPEKHASSDEMHAPSFGSRLRAAREARGLDLESCAHALKLPTSILRKLETDSGGDLDSKVYLASYIGKYARHLGINESSIQVELERIKAVEPVLVATGGISHSRFLLDRYATAATYVVLTAVLAVPMIWLGMRGTLDHDLTHLAPLDASPVAQQDAPASSGSASATRLASTMLAAPPVKVDPAQEQPLMASMAPFPNLESVTPAAVPAVVPPSVAPVDSGHGAHSVGLALDAASWVEVTDSDGSRLQYGLLPAGSSKVYHSDKPLDVRIGNAMGAKVVIDGQPVGLDDFRHANVAHFRVRMQDGKASASSL
jgi:cytoskeleton protein RodZ